MFCDINILLLYLKGLVDPARHIERLIRTRILVQEELDKATSLKMDADRTQTNKWQSKVCVAMLISVLQ